MFKRKEIWHNLNRETYFTPFKHKLFGLSRSKYIEVYANDDTDKWSKGDILLFSKFKYPIERNDYVLMENLYNKKIRICQCTHPGKYTFPDLYDGPETPGIGYQILGVFEKIRKNKITK